MKYRLFIGLLAIMFVVPAWSQDDFSMDEKLGAEAAVQVEQMMGTYRDSILNDYVSRVGRRLTQPLGNTPIKFRFHVVDMAEPNAFALPGGYIYVSRGILSLINEEAELAGVLGHEMVHVTKRHSIKQMKKGIWPALLQIPGALVGLVNQDLGRIINVPVNFGSSLFMSSYSRKQEREADELGIKLSSSAGYDPGKLSVVLQHLAKEVENQSGEEEKKSYFSSHPYTPKRVEDIDERAPTLQWEAQPPIADPVNLYKKLDGMTLGPNPAQGVFEGTLFRHPDLNFAIAFPEDWKTMNVPVALLAAEPEGNAQVFLGGADPEHKPDSLGKAMAKALVDTYDIRPYRSESLTINGFKGYVLAFKDLSGNKAVDIQMYWVKTEQVMINILGMGYEDYSNSLKTAAESLRPLSAKEKQNFKATRLRLAEATDGESLESFCTRTTNAWDAKTTALMNNLDEDVKLKEGQLLKIARVESYR